MKKGMTIVYEVGNGLYINLTNRCPCNCTFCIRQSSKNEFDHIETLWLQREPTAQEVIEELKHWDLSDNSKYKEITFCGYGEPTEALDNLLTIATFIKSTSKIPVRINTNGLGNLVNKKDITPLLRGKIDAISISLNSSNPEIYENTVRPAPCYKGKAFNALLKFAEDAAKVVPNVTLSTVDTTISHEDEENCEKICKKLGVTYRIREYEEIIN